MTPSHPTRAFWQGRRVFLTGHTGFKGGWLALWLQSLGADVAGFALAPPTEPALFHEAGVPSGMTSLIGDIRDLRAVSDAMVSHRPEIVLHLAAQPLVRLSYAQPVETYATNVMGTVHVLEAARAAGSVRAIVNVTTDKCYENHGWAWGYREDDALGGFDPYSNSKACSELVTSSYRRSFFAEGGVALASARAGNVIGGGDFAADRLVPDILRAFDRDEPVVVRNPHAVRPWQHVLEPLAGYLLLAERLISDGQAVAQAYNFGPRDDDARPVQWIVERMSSVRGNGAKWALSKDEHPHEASFLKLDISKAQAELGWRPRWGLSTALDNVVEWHVRWRSKGDARELCMEQINRYTQLMSTKDTS